MGQNVRYNDMQPGSELQHCWKSLPSLMSHKNCLLFSSVILPCSSSWWLAFLWQRKVQTKLTISTRFCSSHHWHSSFSVYLSVCMVNYFPSVRTSCHFHINWAPRLWVKASHQHLARIPGDCFTLYWGTGEWRWGLAGNEVQRGRPSGLIRAPPCSKTYYWVGPASQKHCRGENQLHTGKKY